MAETLTLEETLSLSEKEYYDRYGNMYNVWCALKTPNNYWVERQYRSAKTHRNGFVTVEVLATEQISELLDEEIFMYLCFVLLSENRWPFE